jgi:hypothetical protein
MVLEPGERFLAHAAATNGPVVATNHRLILPTPAGTHAIDWVDIERAGWNGGEEALVVIEAAPVGDRPRRHRVALAAEQRLLDVIREQVQASVVLSRHVPIMEERGVRISARRRPGDSRLTWKVAVDAGLDVDNAEVRARVDAAVAAARTDVE